MRLQIHWTRCLYCLWLVVIASYQHQALAVQEVDSDDAGRVDILRGRSLLQSGTSCPLQIPACLSRRCTTRILGSRETYVCLRCSAGFLPVRGVDGRSIVQCVCPPGKSLSGGKCEDCPRGSWCPGGNFRDYGGQVIPCNPAGSANDGLTTKTTRATKQRDCVAKAGYVLPSVAGAAAVECPVSTYSPGQNTLRSCFKCQSGLAEDPTFKANNGTRDNKDKVCKVPPGRFWELNVVRICPKGMYREGYADVRSSLAIKCLSCPAGWTTQSIGATSLQQCNMLLPGYMLVNATLGSPPGSLAPQGNLQEQPTAACPIGYYFDGLSLAVYGCLQCPLGSVTRFNGSVSVDDCVVPPGYFVRPLSASLTDTINLGFQAGELVKCPSTAPGTDEEGYYRADWKPYADVTSMTGDGKDVCTKCGQGILNVLQDPDENPLAEPGSLVAASSSSCFIRAGWGMTVDLTDFSKMRAIAPCPNNTYGAEKDAFGLFPRPCIACGKNLKSPAGSTAFEDCKNPDGFGYTSEGANQCPDGFWASAGMMAPCEPCPAGRYTEYVPGDGSWQASIDSCKVLPGHGVYSGSTTDPWAPDQVSSDMNARPCPVGLASKGDPSNALVSTNPVCEKCLDHSSTAAEGSTSCDVCVAGYGGSAGNCALCPYGTYQPGSDDGDGLTCRACPQTAFNHNLGETFRSYGITFFKGMTTSYMCVPRFSQAAAPAGSILALPEEMFKKQDSKDLETCVTSCPVESCCIAEFTADGVCRHAVLPPGMPTAVIAQVGGGGASSMAKLYYKLPPSELSAMSVKSLLEKNFTDATPEERLRLAKTIASGFFAICDLSQYHVLAAEGWVGTSNNPRLVEEPRNVAEWDVPGCNSEYSCLKSCVADATCWGFLFVPDKGYTLRGGESVIGVRSFFASPDPAGMESKGIEVGVVVLTDTTGSPTSNSNK